MKTLQEMFDSSLLEFLSADGSDIREDEIEEIVTSMIPNIAESISESMLSEIKKDASDGLKAKGRDQRQFEKRLGKRWEQPLNLLDLFISLALEAGAAFNDDFRSDAARTNDAVFEALTLLHARSCQVASAILVLLRSGYADDAHARWRALYEIAVVSDFISDRGQNVAEQYLLHDTIQRYKLALKYQRHAEAINYEPLSETELGELKAKRGELINRFGKAFDEDYGWAASVLGKQRPTIGDIEEAVGLEHWRPYYRMASDNVHANAHGTYYRLGLSSQTDRVLLAGPSDMGLADPGHSTAISLLQTTTSLLMTKPNLDGIVIHKILARLEDEVGDAFLEAHRVVEGSEG